MFATSNPVATAQTAMMVTVPPGMSSGQQIQISANGTMMNVVIPQGVSSGQQFQVMVPATPVATPVAAPVALPVQARAVQGGGDDDGPMAVYVPPGGDDPIVQAKILREVNLDRQFTDGPWGVGFCVALLVSVLIGSYEVSNALDVSSSRQSLLEERQARGDSKVWCDYHDSDYHGKQYLCAIRSVQGPTTTGRVIPLNARATTADCSSGQWQLVPGKTFCTQKRNMLPTGQRCETHSSFTSGRRRLRKTSSSQHEPPPPPAFVDKDGETVTYDDGSVTAPSTDDASAATAASALLMTWEDANAYCKTPVSGKTARLCTASELTSATGNIGCGGDKPWTLEACDGGHNVLVSGATEPLCSADCNRRPVQCCAYTISTFAAADEAADTASYALAALKNSTSEDEDVDMSIVIGPTLAALFTGMFLAVVSGLAYIYGLRAQPRCLTWFANLFFPSMMLLVGFVLLISPAFILGVIMIIIALICFAMVWCWRAQLELTAQLLKIGSQGLIDNNGLILTNFILQLVQTLLEVPLLVFLIASQYQSAEWSEVPYMPGDACVSISDFAYDSSPTRYFHGFMLIWVGMLLMEMVVHNIGATIAIWYFHKDDESFPYPKSPAFTTLKWGFGSGFGSLCMASFILTVVRIIVAMIEQAERNAREQGGAAAFVMCILSACARYLEAWIQFITKLSVWPSCKQTMGLLFRNYLDGVVIDRE
jgi:hypothetical protein